VKEVVFKGVHGMYVPCRPWPQAFYVSRFLCETNAIEVRPLTLTGLAKGVAKNFVTMNWWRLLFLLRKAGFLDTTEGCQLSLRDWRWDFWRTPGC